MLPLPTLTKKLKTISLFALGILIVAIAIFNFKSFQGNAHGDSGNLIIYDDQLGSGFANWSWGSSVDLNASSPVEQGSKSISFTPSAWGGLYFHTDNTIDLTQYVSLKFFVQPSKSGQDMKIVFYDENNNALSTTLPFSKYVSSPSINSWNTYTIPVSDITPIASKIKGIAFQDSTGNSQPAVFFDDIELIKSTPTPTPTTVSAVLGASANSSGSSYDIFTDSLKSGWTNWSWGSSVNFNVNNPVQQGSTAISFTPTQGYAGFYLHTDGGVDTSPYSSITFAAKASQDGEKFAVQMYDANNQQLHDGVSLDNFGGQPTSGSWKVYNIPLSSINAANKTIKGIALFSPVGNSQPALFIDSIALTGQTGTASQIVSAASVTPSAGSGSSTSVSITPSPSISITPTAAPIVLQPVNSSGNPLAGATFFNDPDTNDAQNQYQQWLSSRPTDAQMMKKIADQPKATWLGNWNANIQNDTKTKVDKAASMNSVPVFIAYNIPNRDCGSYSAGGSNDGQAYKTWIDGLASGIGSHKAVVVVEPDALAQITCLSAGDQQTRYDLLKYAVQKLKSLGNTAVYLDAAHSGWIDPNTMATRLKQAGIDGADGFSINVSNFDTTDISTSYGMQISGQVGGKHFIIDTSRNGNGPSPDNQWCNPSGRALGAKPTTQTGNGSVDGYLWLKYPGESDGSCNGGPAAGQWYPDYALGLAQRASW